MQIYVLKMDQVPTVENPDPGPWYAISSTMPEWETFEHQGHVYQGVAECEVDPKIIAEIMLGANQHQAELAEAYGAGKSLYTRG